MRRCNLILPVTLLLAAACGSPSADAQLLGGSGLTRWGRPTQLPARPLLPGRVRPIRPIHPIYPWHPGYGPRIILAPQLYPYPNYYYPPGRWDAPAWDGTARNVEPPAQPEKPPQPKPGPRVLEWNEAKGRADVYDLQRWDSRTESSPQAQPQQAESPPPTSPGTETLHRWDAPRDNP